LYKKARNNEIKNFTGINDPYEEPPNPDVVINTEEHTAEESVSKILDFLKLKKCI
jgi:adenylylsulfate kinase